MGNHRQNQPPAVESRVFNSIEEIDRGIQKLLRRIKDLEELDVPSAVLNDTGADDVVRSDIGETIREVFGPNSPEFNEHGHISIWAGGMTMGLSQGDVIDGTERGQVRVTGILKGLISRLEEKRDDLGPSSPPSPADFFPHLNLHPRIADVSVDLFVDGHHWEAVFAAAKTLVNYVKECSGEHELDGAPLVRRVFSKNDPILAFNDLKNQTDRDEQEGMMHLFEGAVLGMRNPGGHAFPEGPEQRAMEYISFLSLLAFRTQESKRRKVGG